MHHAGHVFFQQQVGLGGTAEVGVASVIQQAHAGGVGQRHQAVQVVGGLDIRAHVVVVGQRDAIGFLQMCAKGVQPFCVGFPKCVTGKAGALGQRCVDLALDGAGAFAVDHHLDAVVLQLAHVRLTALDFCRDAVFGQKSRIPARHASQSKRIELGLEGRAVLGKFIAQLEAFVADFLALCQRGFQRGFTAQRGQVVVHPAQGVDAYAYIPVHGDFFRSSVILLACFACCQARWSWRPAR